MKKKPDIMFVLSMVAFFGVCITTVVEAQADEMAYELSATGEQTSPLFQKADKGSRFSLNLALSVSIEGEVYDVSLGQGGMPATYNSVNEQFDASRPRYAFVGFALGW